MSERSTQEPLVPIEVDLREFPFMPLDVVRLRDSSLSVIDNAEAFRANVISWCVSWHQTPAASLPDDDVELCRLLGYGRDLKLWRKVRAAGGLRGWILCTDGRLYHPVVADKAIDAWDKRKKQSARTHLATEARKRLAAERNEQRNVTCDDNRNDDVVEHRNDTPHGDRNGSRDGASTNNRNVHQGEERRGEQGETDAADAAITEPEKDLFKRGKEILGKTSGGLIRQLLTTKKRDVALARAAIEMASTKQDPREYIGRIVRGRDEKSEAIHWQSGIPGII